MTGLNVLLHIDLPFRVFSVPHYLKGGSVPFAQWATDLASAKLTIGGLTQSQHGQQTRREDHIVALRSQQANTIALKHAERTLEYLMRTQVDNPPVDKDGWFPLFHASMHLMGLMATSFCGGHSPGGARISRNFDEAWLKGIVDVEAIYNGSGTQAFRKS